MGMNELMEQAAKEGIDVDSHAEPAPSEGAKAGESPAPVKEAKETTQPSGAENTAVPQVTDSAEKVRKEAFKQASEWKHRAKDLEKRLAETERVNNERYQRLLEERAFGKKETAGVDPNVEQDLLKLVQLIKQSPTAAKELGLGGIQELQKEIETLRTARVEETFNSELDKSLDTYSTRYGIPREELEERFTEFLGENEDDFGKKDYRPGLIDKAMKVMLFDDQAELAERSFNNKRIEEDKKKKSANAESASTGSVAPGSSKPNPGGLRAHLDKLFGKDGVSV